MLKTKRKVLLFTLAALFICAVTFGLNVGAFNKRAHATEYIDEIYITSETTAIDVGDLPAFTVDSETEHLSVQPFSTDSASIDSYWCKYYEEHSAWFYTKTAIADGLHYAMRVRVVLDGGYAFASEVALYFNGEEATGYSAVIRQGNSSYVYAYIDFGTVGDEPISEIHLTSKTTKAFVGALSPFEIEVEEQNVSTYPYDYFETQWTYLPSGEENWHAFIYSRYDPYADSDGTRYALTVNCYAEGDYCFAHSVRIYFNGTDVTDFGFTSMSWGSWGICVDIDLGEAVIGYPITYKKNTVGGSTWSELSSLGEYTLVALDETGITAPEGKVFKGWAVGSPYAPLKQPGDVVIINDETRVYAVWEDRSSAAPVSQSPSPAVTEAGGGLGVGAIIGIVVGSAAVCGLGAFAVVWFAVKKKTWADFIAIFKKK